MPWENLVEDVLGEFVQHSAPFSIAAEQRMDRWCDRNAQKERDRANDHYHHVKHFVGEFERRKRNREKLIENMKADGRYPLYLKKQRRRNRKAAARRKTEKTHRKMAATRIALNAASAERKARRLAAQRPREPAGAPSLTTPGA